MTQYVKKPISVRAIQWNGPNDNEKCFPATIYSHPVDRMQPDAELYWFVASIEANLRLIPGCWIVGPGAHGEYWPVQDDIFKATYEVI